MTTMIESDCIHNIQSKGKGENSMASYDPKKNKYINKYKQEHYKSLRLEVSKEFYSDVLAPAAEAKGMPIATYVKEAITEKVERETGCKPEK